ncbi:MAG: hypothetical protein LBF41_00805, partial [Deltaproteobacteria bacterium]|nr:hypothetical protein [Deltaproteobacteria bacterium]
MPERLTLPDSLKSPRPRAKALGMMALFSLAMSQGALGLWMKLGAMAGASPHFGLVFVSTALFSMALGGLWWGAVARSEVSLLEPTLSFAVFASILTTLALGFVLPDNPAVRRSPLVALSVFPSFFLWGAPPVLLTALAFPNERGTGKGLFTVFSSALFVFGLGLAGTALAMFLGGVKNVWILESSGAMSLGLVLWIRLTRVRTGEETPFRFWPGKSLGYFTFEPGYGQELLVSSRSGHTLVHASFVAAVAAGALVFSLARADLPFGVPEFLKEDWGRFAVLTLPASLGALV